MKIEYTEDGKIKNFSVPDACHFYVTAIHAISGEELRKEAIALSEPTELFTIIDKVDPEDGLVMGKKWALTKEVLKAVLENGEAVHQIPGHVLFFKYKLVPMKFKDELKHLG